MSRAQSHNSHDMPSDGQAHVQRRTGLCRAKGHGLQSQINHGGMFFDNQAISGAYDR
jgi:hypothetical protein